MRGLLELLITIQLLIGTELCRGSLQKENAQIDRVISQLSPVYIFKPCTPNIDDNVLPFTPWSSKWSISLNYLDCSSFNFFHFLYEFYVPLCLVIIFRFAYKLYIYVLCNFLEPSISPLRCAIRHPVLRHTLCRKFGSLLICLGTKEQIN